MPNSTYAKRNSRKPKGPAPKKTGTAGTPGFIKATAPKTSGNDANSANVHSAPPMPTLVKTYASALGTGMHPAPQQAKPIIPNTESTVQQNQQLVQPYLQVKNPIPTSGKGNPPQKTDTAEQTGSQVVANATNPPAPQTQSPVLQAQNPVPQTQNPAPQTQSPVGSKKLNIVRPPHVVQFSLHPGAKSSFTKYAALGWSGKRPDQTPGTSAGKVFQNKDKKLPLADGSGKPITYREFDVNNKLPHATRDAERFVRGSDGNIYYTSDHYTTFQKL